MPLPSGSFAVISCTLGWNVVRRGDREHIAAHDVDGAGDRATAIEQLTQPLIHRLVEHAEDSTPRSGAAARDIGMHKLP
jgi:hypothetical protein